MLFYECYPLLYAAEQLRKEGGLNEGKKKHEIQEYCSLLILNAIGEQFEEVIKNATDYEGFLHQLLRMEVDAEEVVPKSVKSKQQNFPTGNI